jgi:two-component system CheB/CheR fusion protein
MPEKPKKLGKAAKPRKENAPIEVSDTGADGTVGLKAIKGESGMVMVQQVQSAKYAGMPSSAIATGLADYVLPAQEMAKQLLAYARGPYLAERRAEESPFNLPGPMQKIFVGCSDSGRGTMLSDENGRPDAICMLAKHRL